MKRFLLLLILFSCTLFDNDEKQDESPFAQESVDWPSLADSPWPMFRHDPQGTGRFDGIGPSGNSVIELYNPSIGFNMGSVAVGGNDNIYFTVSAVGDDNCLVNCVSTNGTLLWSTDICEDDNFAEISGAPLLTIDGKVIIGTPRGYIYCLDANSGEVVWNVDTGYPLYSSYITIGIDGTIYTWNSGSWLEGIPNQLIALNSDGEILWINEDNNYGITFNIAGDVLYTNQGRLIARSSSDGSVLWESTLSRSLYILVDNDDNIYGLNIMDNFLYSLFPDGSERWTIQMDSLTLDHTIAPCIDIDGNIHFIGLKSVGMDYPENYLISVSNDGSNYIKTYLGESIKYVGTHLVTDNLGIVYAASWDYDWGTVEGVVAVQDGSIIWDIDGNERGFYGCPAFLSTGELVLLPSESESPMNVRLIQ